jgi:putative SOS response-associated peptidase YedK
VCNRYGMKDTQDQLRSHFKLSSDKAGNLQSLSNIYPDQLAPVIGLDETGRRGMTIMRWGYPGPSIYGSQPVTNIRNTESKFWKSPLSKIERRCIVPWTMFCEWTDKRNSQGRKDAYWFAPKVKEPVAFAGIWTKFNGTRGPKSDPVTGEHLVFSFLTTDANKDVAPIHAKAMPVILRENDWDIWLTEPFDRAIALQRPAPNGFLSVEKE